MSCHLQTEVLAHSTQLYISPVEIYGITCVSAANTLILSMLHCECDVMLCLIFLYEFSLAKYFLFYYYSGHIFGFES